MDDGFVVLEGIVIFCLAAYAFWVIVPPIVLNIIWIRRVKSGKSRMIGPLGIISIIVTAASLLALPKLFTMAGEYFGWI